MGDRLLLGADIFYAVDLASGSKQEFLSLADSTRNYASARDAARQDFPVGSVLISATEVLLAYQSISLVQYSLHFMPCLLFRLWHLRGLWRNADAGTGR